MNVRRWSRLGSGLAVALFAATAAQAQITTYSATLSGPNEFPPNASPATGITWATHDAAAHTLRIQAAFGGLLSTTTAAHIHCCVDQSAVPPTAAPATQVPSFVLFPLGVTAGSFDQTLDLTDLASWNPTFVAANGGTTAGAEAAFVAGLNAGDAYFNIHTARPGGFPGGEIRGFYTVTPEPSTYALMATGLLAIAGVARKRRRA